MDRRTVRILFGFQHIFRSFSRRSNWRWFVAEVKKHRTLQDSPGRPSQENAPQNSSIEVIETLICMCIYMISIECIILSNIVYLHTWHCIFIYCVYNCIYIHIYIYIYYNWYNYLRINCTLASNNTYFGSLRAGRKPVRLGRPCGVQRRTFGIYKAYIWGWVKTLVPSEPQNSW